MIITDRCTGGLNTLKNKAIAFQEARYGLNKRIANRVKSNNDSPLFRCTVCAQTSGAR